MGAYKDSIEILGQAIEKAHRVNARFKQKVFIREQREAGQSWEGDVFFFELVYDSKHNGATKEQIANWQLAGPTPDKLAAAEKRGLKLRKQLENDRARSPESRRKAKLAYAWSTPVKGSEKRKFHVVLHEGPIKSPADAVRAAMKKDS